MTFRSDALIANIDKGALGRLFVLSALFVAIYVAVDAATYALPNAPFAATPWNPHPALALALLISRGLQFAPAVWFAVLVAEVLVREAPGTQWGTLLACSGMALAYVATALGVRRFTRVASADASLRDIATFAAIVTAGAAAAAAFYSGAYWLDGTLEVDEAGRVFTHLWAGDLLGLVVITPLLLLLAGGAFAQWRTLDEAARWTALRNALLLILALAALLALVFGVQAFDQLRMSYLLFLPMIAFALRYGLIGAAISLPCLQIGLLLSLVVTGALETSAVEFQLLMLTLTVTTLCFGALASERRRSADMLAARERELRAQQSALNDAQRSASAAELAAALAHELNQPLSAISTYAGACRVLASSGTNQQQLLDTLGRMAEESTRAGRFVRRMREFFRTGATHVERTPVGLLVDAAHAQVADQLERHNIRWKAFVPADLPALLIDRVQVGTVLANLLGNAIDALAQWPGPRLIEVVAKRTQLNHEEGIRIEVRDSGPGVDPDVRERLFQPMSTSKPEGMGLGLTISRSIAEQHGGRLLFDAQAADATVFCVELPAENSDRPMHDIQERESA